MCTKEAGRGENRPPVTVGLCIIILLWGMVTLAPWPLSKHVSKVPSPSPASVFFFFGVARLDPGIAVKPQVAPEVDYVAASKKDAGALCQSNDLGMRARRSKEGCRRLEEGEVGGAPRRAG